VPDYRGIFLRGVGSTTVDHGAYGAALHSSGDLGEVQGDAIRNVTGTLTPAYEDWTFNESSIYWEVGAFYATRVGNSIHNEAEDSSGYAGVAFNFDASRVVPTANENRPVNAAVRYLIKAE
jgi:hypothetical protein